MTLDLGNEQELYDAMGCRTALKRLADPEEVSRVILFLLSSEASYITGTVSLPIEKRCIPGARPLTFLPDNQCGRRLSIAYKIETSSSVWLQRSHSACSACSACPAKVESVVFGRTMSA